MDEVGAKKGELLTILIARFCNLKSLLKNVGCTTPIRNTII